MDSVRYYLALILVAMYPPAFLFWFVVHPFIGFWRRAGATVTYAVNLPAMVAVMYLLFRSRDTILSVEYGTRPTLIVVGLVLYAVAVVVEVQCRRHLSLRTLVGVPELKAEQQGPGELLSEGIYARVRHPRYLGVMVGGAGIALVANYLAGYAVMLLLVPVLYALMLLEERELQARFGNAYARYARDVPRIIPRFT